MQNLCFQVPKIAGCVASVTTEIQGQQQGSMLDAEVPGQCQEHVTQTLIARLMKTHLFLSFQKLEGPWSPFCDLPGEALGAIQ